MSDYVILGANGRLGSALQAALDAACLDYSAYGRNALDIMDAAKVDECLKGEQPRWVINCAAMTNVDDCELEPWCAMEVNRQPIHELIRSCQATGAKLCQVSTDYVFDGVSAPYSETDDCRPISVYGVSKLLGEIACHDPDALVVRTSTLYGDAERPAFVESVFKTAMEGGSYNAATDVRSSPSYAPDVARGILWLTERGSAGVWHVVNEGAPSRYELALFAAEQIGPECCEIVACIQSELGLRARRPADSSLSVAKLKADGFVMLPWQDAVAEWAKEWKHAEACDEGFPQIGEVMGHLSLASGDRVPFTRADLQSVSGNGWMVERPIPGTLDRVRAIIRVVSDETETPQPERTHFCDHPADECEGNKCEIFGSPKCGQCCHNHPPDAVCIMTRWHQGVCGVEGCRDCAERDAVQEMPKHMPAAFVDSAPMKCLQCVRCGRAIGVAEVCECSGEHNVFGPQPLNWERSISDTVQPSPVGETDWERRYVECPEGGEHDFKPLEMSAGITRDGEVCSKCNLRKT